MQKEKKCLAIVPAYNEEKSIEKVVKDVLKQGCDVLVINDCSKDNTSEIAKKAGAIVIDLVNNLGIGGGVQTGYKYAKENEYQFAFQIDGDGQHDPKYIKEMLETMDREKANIVIGSRFIKDLGYKQTFMRKLGGNFISNLIKAFSGVKICDPASGYRLVDRKIIELFALEYPYDYPEPETNLSMALKGFKIKEIPMKMHQREFGNSFVTPITAIWYMVKVTLALIIQKLKGGKK